MKNINLREDITRFIKIKIYEDKRTYKVQNVIEYEDYIEKYILYEGTEGDWITAFLLEPKGTKNGKGLLIHHQHNGEWHYGKSEVVGKVGDTNQHLGVKFVKRGYTILAPDAICFEDRRHHLTGVLKDKNDFIQHYTEMNKRILLGESLMKKVVEESSISLSILLQQNVEPEKVGIIGHSYGGTTALFHGALDERIRYICTSGAVASYKRRIQECTGIEMASIIPGFIEKYEIVHVLKAALPREILIMSASQDKYSIDADLIYNQLMAEGDVKECQRIEHYRVEGHHPLTEERVAKMVEWFEGK